MKLDLNLEITPGMYRVGVKIGMGYAHDLVQNGSRAGTLRECVSMVAASSPIDAAIDFDMTN